MKSALLNGGPAQQAPKTRKMKSVTLLNKQEKLFTNNIYRAFLACCFLRMLERINRIRGLLIRVRLGSFRIMKRSNGFRAAQSLALFYSKGPFP